MFIVKIYTSSDIHTYSVDGGQGRTPYIALLELHMAFSALCKDWAEPVEMSIMSDSGTYYKSSTISSENIVSDANAWIPLNEASIQNTIKNTVASREKIK